MIKEENKKELIRTIKFTLFSISAGAIQMILFEILYSALHQDYWLSYLIALIASVIWNFTLNREYTFKSANNIPIAMTKVAIFYAIFTPVSTIAGNDLEKAGWNGTVVLIITMLCNFVLEYLYDRIFVFGASIDTKVKKEKKNKKTEE